MTRKAMTIVLAIFLTFSFIGSGIAMEMGNKRKGKYTYRKVYKACNERGEVDSPKPPINPDAKTQAQWQRTFEDKDFEDFGCKEEWSALSGEELSDIYAYLYEHAADSPTPAKCK